MRYKSDQIAQWEAPGHAPLRPNELGGRVRLARFSFLLSREYPDELEIPVGSTIRLVQIPAGASIIGISLFLEADFAGTVFVGARGADGSGYIYDPTDTYAGVPDNETFLSGNAIPWINKDWLRNAYASTYRPGRTRKETEITMTAGAESFPDEEISGFVRYVLD